MHLQIQLPDNLEAILKEHARRAGVPVESIVIQAVTAGLSDLTQPNNQATADEFSAWLREWANKFPKLDHPIEDNRDSNNLRRCN
ncbi:MAG: hypothetical protein MUC43_08105 [Pirellula sp.]|nr:hypothetical protein [Pirellula sp.]